MHRGINTLCHCYHNYVDENVGIDFVDPKGAPSLALASFRDSGPLEVDLPSGLLCICQSFSMDCTL